MLEYIHVQEGGNIQRTPWRNTIIEKANTYLIESTTGKECLYSAAPLSSWACTVLIKHVHFSPLCGMHYASMFAVIADMYWLSSDEIHSCSEKTLVSVFTFVTNRALILFVQGCSLV
jgi:hypothetical protein